MKMENFKRQFEELLKDKDAESGKFFSWLRYLISMTATLLGILIALRDSSNQSYSQHIFFALTILLMSSSIIFGSILLFTEIKLLRLAIKQREIWLTKLINNENEYIEFQVINPPWYFQTLKIISITCFYSALVSLVTYALISEFTLV